ncbi:MAG TPA: hypothetical protein VFJ53_00280 [Solirubrobacterales bacterium]|nr:hypothetical protein [Solirubrobacterales bacterium]
MIDAALDILDRQLAYLSGLGDADLLYAAGDFLDALSQDPQLTAHLEDLCHEIDDLGREFNDREHDRGAPGKLLERIWEDLGKELQNPQLNELTGQDREFRYLLGSFEHPLILPLDPSRKADDEGRVGGLIALIAQLDVSDGHAIIDRYRGAYEALVERQGGIHRQLLARTRTDPGAALLRLRCLAAMSRGMGVAEARSCPRDPDLAPALVVRPGAPWETLFEYLAGGDEELDRLTGAPPLVASMRAAADRLGLELRGRLGTTRSRLAVIERFKARCEWHDRSRLFALAEEAASNRKQESVLRDELALYLFDQSLNPISEAALGEHSRADVFEPAVTSSFYLEAKQYSNGASLTVALRAAFRQALDTAANLGGSGYAAEEAFIVIYRRGGPRAILPSEPLEFDGLRWYLRLINIAPPSEDASKNKHTPVVYDAAALLEMLTAERTAQAKKPSSDLPPKA